MTNISLSGAVLTVLMLVAGGLVCFAGYKMFRLCIGIAGAIIGGYLGHHIYGLIERFVDITSENEMVEVILIAVFAIILGIVAFALYLKALVTVCTLIGGWWFYSDYKNLLESAGKYAGIASIGIGLVIGLLAGLAVYFIQQWAIIIVTSLSGAKLIASVIVPLISSVYFAEEAGGKLSEILFNGAVGNGAAVIGAILMLLLAGAGLSVQIKTSK